MKEEVEERGERGRGEWRKALDGTEDGKREKELPMEELDQKRK